ncbi:DUF599 domain-containing protein [Jannaschia sp. W003]|uniref:DUF599 domain-containing protein n=1 Tax=Jannaschia sp. W003 TaxID=2867012 RepID=UPI0021A6CDF7|nr:DUF599 domain-containing protein [Jannaschia sp. W003]UWQ22583.1 DUF599 domain-containing protein [Jannaschia sp. W003]
MIADLLVNISLTDSVALGVLGLGWAGSTWAIEHPPAGRPSVGLLMARYRHAWMREMIGRQPRVFDAQILGSLRQGTTFLASAALIAVGGVLALAGNAERLESLALDMLSDAQPTLFLQAKLMPVALLLAHAVFKFIWSNRLFGYCAVVMASTPNDASDPLAPVRARQAADLNARAAVNFNRGLRSIYFAFAALAWLLGGWALLAATLLTLWVVLGREFASQSRAVLLED